MVEKRLMKLTKILYLKLVCILRQTHSSLNSPKLKIKNQEYKTFPAPNLNILIHHIIASLKRRGKKSEIQSRTKWQNYRKRYKDN